MKRSRVNFQFVSGENVRLPGHVVGGMVLPFFAMKKADETPAQAVQRSIGRLLSRRRLGLVLLGRRGPHFIYMMAFGKVRGACRGLVLEDEYVLKVLIETEDGLV